MLDPSSVTLCPIEFAGPVARHNKVLHQDTWAAESGEAEDAVRGDSGCDTERGNGTL